MSDYLDKFNPTTNLFAPFQVDSNLPRNDYAFASWKALLAAKRSHDGLFLIIGKILKDFKEKELFKEMDYRTFTEFLGSEELSFSREKAYMCIKTYEYYIEYLELDPVAVGKMNIGRLSSMVPLLKKINDKGEVVKQIEELNGLRHADFIRAIKMRDTTEGKPTVFWSEEQDRWLINYYEDTAFLHCLGLYSDVKKMYEEIKKTQKD